jgi:hypothetical protein
MTTHTVFDAYSSERIYVLGGAIRTIIANGQKMNLDTIKFEDLINMDNSESVMAEVERNVHLMYPDFHFKPVRTTFDDILKLFRGRYPGYRACNILYHDLKHTTDCLMAMTRLLHGSWTQGMRVSRRTLRLGLIGALMHDTGYIQTVAENTGTGAKYTLVHVDRSITFMQHYFAKNNVPETDFLTCRNLLQCTGLDVNVEEIPFANEEEAFAGKALGAADLLGQMADRTYLERLPLLYREFEEAQVPGFESELDLLRKSPAFWEFAKTRLATTLGDVDRFMLPHFTVRWGIDKDLYRAAIERNISYLEDLLETHPNDYRNFLRRSGIIGRLETIEAAERMRLSS